jgi:hypothetical protein
MKKDEYEELVQGGKQVFYSAVIVCCCILGVGGSILLAVLIHKLSNQ